MEDFWDFLDLFKGVLGIFFAIFWRFLVYYLILIGILRRFRDFFFAIFWRIFFVNLWVFIGILGILEPILKNISNFSGFQIFFQFSGFFWILFRIFDIFSRKYIYIYKFFFQIIKNIFREFFIEISNF